MFLIQAALLAFTCTVAEGALKCTATNGMECVFPFKRPGSPKEYTEPAPSVSSGKHWCATKTNGDKSYDTWSYCRKDDCDVETVDELFERIRPKDECLTCITENNAKDCVRPCVTNPNKLACFNCLLESNALICRPPCVGNRTGDATETLVESIDGDNSCNLISTGPVGTHATPNPGHSFSDQASSKTGNISAISFRTGDWMDQIVTTYGSISAPAHGGSGGKPRLQFVLNGKSIQKVEGFTFSGQNPTHIASLRFTLNDGQQSIYYGRSSGSGLQPFVFDKSSTDCYLKYFQGFTSGNDIKQKKGNYITQLTFVWCC